MDDAVPAREPPAPFQADQLLSQVVQVQQFDLARVDHREHLKVEVGACAARHLRPDSGPGRRCRRRATAKGGGPLPRRPAVFPAPHRAAILQS
jgi:hypothetical protein